MSDSELVIRQLQGRYAVKSPHLAPLHDEVRRLAGLFSRVHFAPVPRTDRFVRMADRRCNSELDAARDRSAP